MNHPALVKTSNQPSFSSANFSPFTSAEALRASDISAVPSLNLQANPRGGRLKKITASPNRKFVAATQKRESNRPPNPKPIAFVECSSWSFKRRKRAVCRDQTPSDTPSDSDTDLAVPFADVSTEKGEQDADCVFCTGRFFEDYGGEEWIRCAKYFRRAHTLCVGMGEDFCF